MTLAVSGGERMRASGLLDCVCHLPDVGGRVEGLRRDIRPVWPADSRPGHEELTKMTLVTEWLKDRPFKPGSKVHGLRGSIVEGEVDVVVAAVLGLNDTWENRHLTPLLFQGRNLSQGLADLCQAPVFLQLTAVQHRPVSNRAKSRARLDGADQQFAVEVELRLELMVLRMKVRRLVIVVEHPNDDPEEHRYRWHGSILPTRGSDFPVGRGFGARKSDAGPGNTRAWAIREILRTGKAVREAVHGASTVSRHSWRKDSAG